MLDFLHCIFPSLNLGPRAEPRKPGLRQLRQRFGYGNELSLKASSPSKVKKRVSFEFEWMPLLQNDENEEKSGTKLKILMRKEAASRLLSKCKDGGILEFEDVAQDLKTIRTGSYVRVLSYNAKDE